MTKIIRSHTRKVAFCYIYMKIFGLLYNNKQDDTTPGSSSDINFGDDDRDFLSPLITASDIDTTNKFRYNFDDISVDIAFVADGCHISTDSLDYDFLDKILSGLENGYSEIDKILNPFLKQFGYNDMDLVKQSLLLLAYLEDKHVKTNHSIIINEIVELAKSYGSSDIYKIINGVLHNYLNL